MKLLGVEGDDAAQGLAHHVQARDLVDPVELSLLFCSFKEKKCTYPSSRNLTVLTTSLVALT